MTISFFFFLCGNSHGAQVYPQYIEVLKVSLLLKMKLCSMTFFRILTHEYKKKINK